MASADGSSPPSGAATRKSSTWLASTPQRENLVHARSASRAIESLDIRPDRVLLDGSHDFVGGGITKTIVKGDATCVSIAAASILAKVSRDRMMRAEAENFPAYDFHRNKGYPCPRHRMALSALGPTTIHRRSWSYMDDLPWSGIHRSDPVTAQASLFNAG
jgi:ribonuclease HII